VQLFTIGHSTRTVEEFLALLHRAGIRRVVDVRAFPGSRRYPHFGREPLGESLATAGLDYAHAPALGGRRKPRPGAPPSAWRNSGFAGFADYMSTPEFREALDWLLGSAAEQRTAIMCSEAVPWRCHRSMISDAVVARGWNVLHILDRGVSPHELSRLAVVEGDQVRYPAAATHQHALPLGGS
jgi:uncharacterized protein (DUF488 family)